MIYGEVIAAKIKTCHSKFRRGGFDPWRSSNFDPCRSRGVDQSRNVVEIWSRDDKSVRQQSEYGRRVERIMKRIEGS